MGNKADQMSFKLMIKNDFQRTWLNKMAQMSIMKNTRCLCKYKLTFSLQYSLQCFKHLCNVGCKSSNSNSQADSKYTRAIILLKKQSNYCNCIS